MTHPAQFILDTDFATLKNDASGTTSVSIPSAVVIPGNGSVSYSADLVIGVPGAVARGRISSSKDSGKWRVGNAIDYIRLGTVLGFPAVFDIYAFLWRPSAGTIRCQIQIQNPYSDPLTTAAGIETVSFFVNTFLPPFSA